MIRKLANNNMDTVAGGIIEKVEPAVRFQSPVTDWKTGEETLKRQIPAKYCYLVKDDITGEYFDANGMRIRGDIELYDETGASYPYKEFIMPYTKEQADKLDHQFNPHRYQ